MSAMIFQSVTLGLVIYLVIWTLVWFRKEVRRPMGGITTESWHMKALANAVNGLKQRVESSYIDQTKDLNHGDCIKICGQLYRIGEIEISISANSRVDISAFKVE